MANSTDNTTTETHKTIAKVVSDMVAALLQVLPSYQVIETMAAIHDNSVPAVNAALADLVATQHPQIDKLRALARVLGSKLASCGTLDELDFPEITVKAILDQVRTTKDERE